MNYWLMKSEPDTYSIDDLKKDKISHWEGVRSYQARNNMRSMEKGDLVLFYHSSTKPPGIAGLAKIVKDSYPDPFQFKKESPYFDPKSTKEKPRWSTVDVQFVKKFRNYITLDQLKTNPKLKEMVVAKAGRLSVQPVTRQEFEVIEEMAT